MNAVVKDRQRYTGLPEAEVAARLRHEQQLETRIRRRGLLEWSVKCTHCRKGRVEINAHYSAHGRFISASGLCSTPGCLDWGN